MKIEIFNSSCKIRGIIPPAAEELIHKLLTTYNDISAEVKRLQFSKRYKKTDKERKIIDAQIRKLKASEYVYWYKDGEFPTGHLNLVKRALDITKINYTLVDKRVVPGRDGIFKWNNRPFPPRYYQKEAIDACVKAGRGVIEAAVGSGKSLMMAYVLKELAVNTVIVVPSRGLSDQIYQDFRIWFGETKVGIMNTAKVRKGGILPQIRIITVQSMASLQKTGELYNLVHDINCIMVDEVHHAGSDSYLKLLPEIEHIYYRYGFTGTFLRNRKDGVFLDLWGFLSNVIYRYPASQAMKDGFLTPIQVNVYDIAGQKTKSYQKEYDKNYCESQDLLIHIEEICRSNPGQQILILVKKKDKAGLIIHEYLKAHGITNSYISGDDSKEVITQTISDFNDLKVNILIGSSVVGEGIDIRSTEHLIMAQGGKSEVSIVQAVGRLVRLFKGKVLGYLHDFNFTNTNYMGKHLAARLDIYERNFKKEDS